MCRSSSPQTKYLPEIELPLRDPVRVEVGSEGRDVTNVGVIHQSAEGDGSSVQIVEDLGPPPNMREYPTVLKTDHSVVLPGPRDGHGIG